MAETAAMGSGETAAARLACTLPPGKALLQIVKGYSDGEIDLLVIQPTVIEPAN